MATSADPSSPTLEQGENAPSLVDVLTEVASDPEVERWFRQERPQQITFLDYMHLNFNNYGGFSDDERPDAQDYLFFGVAKIGQTANKIELCLRAGGLEHNSDFFGSGYYTFIDGKWVPGYRRMPAIEDNELLSLYFPTEHGITPNLVRSKVKESINGDPSAKVSDDSSELPTQSKSVRSIFQRVKKTPK